VNARIRRRQHRQPWDQEAEDAAASGRAFHPDLAALQLHQPFREGQAESDAFVAARGRAVDLTELLEEALLVLRLDADPGVTDLDDRAGRALGGADDHAAMMRREFD